MKEDKEIGWISNAEFGMGGYQNAQIGFSFSISGEGWGVSDFWGYWADKPSGAQWTDQQRRESLGSSVMKLRKLLSDAHKDRLSQLSGTSVEVTFRGQKLHDWRILTEVIPK